ncbi:hypothetical protein [Pseudobacteroides cellulosolvens]|uniref:Uncharacterized protein n=1 Tax=Pseudobacteroides cellulosolvens ATCC 35603 = DSM 2933 TaxID=398512 RepID=A0A0L6JK65_9FIRM|nr:hypothetical protein [Pseudobacteroides cellulosolvens]KNY26155.1 hypothetical protein Bccel_1417 [Pseudobacteroides cellulosolvens ATCC 35603 = DSM 2933]
MKRIVIVFAALIVLTVAIFAINRVYNENKGINFDEMEMRKIAWDSLSEGEKKSVVKDGAGLSAVVDGKKEVNINGSDIWKYAEVGLARYKDISSLNTVKVVYNGEKPELDIITKIKRWYLQNHKVVRVSFKTTMDGLLGPITLYIDPDNKEIIGEN